MTLNSLSTACAPRRILPGTYGSVQYFAKSKTRNHIPGTKGPEKEHTGRLLPQYYLLARVVREVVGRVALRTLCQCWVWRCTIRIISTGCELGLYAWSVLDLASSTICMVSTGSGVAPYASSVRDRIRFISAGCSLTTYLVPFISTTWILFLYRTLLSVLHLSWHFTEGQWYLAVSKLTHVLHSPIRR
eukprot:3030866-Rhodomonas_salina.2